MAFGLKPEASISGKSRIIIDRTRFGILLSGLHKDTVNEVDESQPERSVNACSPQAPDSPPGTEVALLLKGFRGCWLV